MSDNWTGRTISKVKIIRLLDRGGMAEVYLGHHSTLDIPVAVKIMHSYLAEDSQLRQRAHVEARTVASLRHPNIVQIFDFDFLEGRPYIIMERLDGISLADFLRANHKAGLSLPLPTIDRIVAKVASALTYAHDSGVIHRDIKPANVMLRSGQTPLRPELPLPQDAEPVITDFGLARLSSGSTHTADGTILGTPHYMSPEQVAGAKIDHRSDIYSLGVMVYEMLSGTLPFGDAQDTPASVLYKQVHEPPPPMAATDPALQAAVKKALEKDPGKRYDSAVEFAAALHPLLDYGATAASTDVRAQGRAASAAGRKSTVRLTKPNLRGLRIAGMIVLAVVAIAGSFMILRGLPGLRASQPNDLTAPTKTDAPSTPAPTIPATVADEIPATASESTVGMLIRNSFIEVNLTGSLAETNEAQIEAVLLSDTESPLPIGQLSPEGGAKSATFTHPDGLPILGRFDQIQLIYRTSDESPDNQMSFTHELSPELSTAFGQLNKVYPDEPQVDALLIGLTNQGSHFNSHRNFALDALAAENLESGRAHSEHVINILVGPLAEDFGDWNGNDLVENPGDDVGFIPYLEMLDVLLTGSTGDEGSEVESLHQQILGMKAEADEAMKVAQQIALADSLEVVVELGIDEELSGFELSRDAEAFVAEAGELELGYRTSFTLSPGS